MGRKPKSKRPVQPRKQVSYATDFKTDAHTLPKLHLARTTLRAALGAWNAWVSYCEAPDIQRSARPEDLADVGVEDLRSFLHWHVNFSQITKLSSLYVFARQFRQAYKIQCGKEMDFKFISEMRYYIENDLRVDFNLDEVRSDKPVLNVDDLLATLHYHWTLCDAWFATERQRVQLSLILLLIVYTSARPSALIVTEKELLATDLREDEKKFIGQFTSWETAEDSLKYKDIQMFKVQGESKDDHVFLMVVTLRLMKGQRNKSLAPKYVFHERDDNLAFCPILHVLALAFADQAFSSPWIRAPQDLYTFQIDECRGLQAIPLEWKSEMLDVPLFRRSTDGREAWTYSDAREANLRLGQGVGFAENLAFYQGRRGAGEAFNARTSVAVRNRAMGHARADIFDKYYTNQTVAADTQSAFLGTPSQDWMISLASHLGLTRDPSAKSLVPEPTKQEVDCHPDVAPLCAQLQQAKDEISAQYGNIQRAKGTQLQRLHNAKRKELRATQLRAKKELYSRKWKEHFKKVGATEISRQRTGQEAPQLPSKPSRFEFEERELLSTLMCRNEDITGADKLEVLHRRTQALSAMAALSRRRQAPRQRQRCSGSDSRLPQAGSVPALDLVPDALSGNQCPWCLHDEGLSMEARQFAYSQVSKLREHIEKKHFPQDAVATAESSHRCPFACCGQTHQSDDHLKNHLARTHDFFCAPRVRSPPSSRISADSCIDPSVLADVEVDAMEDESGSQESWIYETTPPLNADDATETVDLSPYCLVFDPPP